MRVAFFGTPEPAAVALRAVLGSSHEVACVVTQADKPRGRGRKVTAAPVKQVADEHGVPTLQPATPKEDTFAADLAAFEPGALAVVAYGFLLPKAVLEVAPAMNVHFSLLPAYRGAAPVQRALMDGVSETGVSVFLLEPTMDTGPVVAREAVAVGADDTTGEVLERLAPIGARLLVRALDDLEAGTLQPQPQDDTGASLAPKIKPEDTVIDWSRPAAAIQNQVRALSPRPGAATTAKGKRLLVWRARAVEAPSEPGVVLEAGDRLVVGTREGGLELVEVQPEGKRPMSGKEYLRGYRPHVGHPVDGA